MTTEITQFIKDLTNSGEEATISSLKVAERFGKLHKNVLRDIENLGCSDEFRRLNFEPTINKVKGPKGAIRDEPMYQITRDGFAILAMGFTGPEAMKWKEAYIDAFNYLLKAHITSLQEKAVHVMQHPLALKNRNRISARDMNMLEDQRFTTLKRIRETDDTLQKHELYITLQQISCGMGRPIPSRHDLGLPHIDGVN